MVHGVGILLLSAIGGYWVLERASGHRGRLKQVGQLLGGLIIIVSLVGVACRVWCLAAGKGGFCPLGKKGGWQCPFSSKTSSPVDPRFGVSGDGGADD